MFSTSDKEVEYQSILEALSKSVASTRASYDDNLDSDSRKGEVAKADVHIGLLTDTFTTLVTGIKKDRNFYIPINRLVDDLLIEIWSYTDLRDRFSSSQVCSRWRRVALSAPNLWTMIDMEDNLVVRLRNLLQRSGTSSLHVVVGIKKLGSGITFPNNRPHHPTSFTYYNHRTLSAQWPHPFAPNFSPSGLSTDKFPFVTQKEFDGFVGRCATLDALVQQSHTFYISPQSAALRTPMPNLKTLRLCQGDASQMNIPGLGIAANSSSATNVISDSFPFPLFQKYTPKLREICFDTVHARWEDPIYRHLSNLRLYGPNQKASIPQILRILQACPKLTDLELTRCLVEGSPVVSEHSDNAEGLISASDSIGLDNHIVSLPYLKYFHFEDFDHTSTINFLSSISLPQLQYLYVNTAEIRRARRRVARDRPNRSSFTDRFGRPLKSIADTIREPSYLCINAQSGSLVLSALYPVRDVDPSRPFNKYIKHPAIHPPPPTNYYSGYHHIGQMTPAVAEWRQKRVDTKTNENGNESGNTDDMEGWDRKESGLWTFVTRADTHGLVAPTSDIEEWKAAAFTLGLPMTSGSSFSSSTSSSSHFSYPTAATTSLLASALTPASAPAVVNPQPAMNSNSNPNPNLSSLINRGISPLLVPLSRELIELFDNATLGGLQFRSVEKLHLISAFNHPDIFYYDILSRCSGVKKLKVSYSRGVGILAAVVRDELLPNLEEVYLDGMDARGSTPAQPTTDVLLDWVEVRQMKAVVSKGIVVKGSKRIKVEFEGSPIHRLKKIFIQFYGDNQSSLSEDVKKRFEEELGEGGEFIWKSIVNPLTDIKQQWAKVIETDGEISVSKDTDANNDAGEEVFKANNELRAGHDSATQDPMLQEWPLTGARLVQGWSAGPW